MRKRIAISFLVSTILVGMFAGISVTATEVQNSEVLIENEPTMEEPEVLIEEEISTYAVTSTTTGWFKENGIWFYREPSGELSRGWRTIGEKTYYFDPMNSNMYENGWKYVEEDGKKYFFAVSGELASGWMKDESYGWYYIKNGLYYDGWLQDKGIWYYIEDGRMVHDQYNYEIDGVYYGFGPSGAMLKGWNKTIYTHENGTSNSDWYYYNTNGSAPSGWLQIEGIWYYFYNGWMADDGVRLVGESQTAYGFNPNGSMMTGVWYQDTWENEWYYFDVDGKGLNGWKQGVNGWYYCVNGKMLHDCWYQTGENAYSQFDSNGIWLGTSTSPGE